MTHRYNMYLLAPRRWLATGSQHNTFWHQAFLHGLIPSPGVREEGAQAAVAAAPWEPCGSALAWSCRASSGPVIFEPLGTCPNCVTRAPRRIAAGLRDACANYLCGTEHRGIEVGQALPRRRLEPVTEAVGPEEPGDGPLPPGECRRTATPVSERVDAVTERLLACQAGSGCE